MTPDASLLNVWYKLFTVAVSACPIEASRLAMLPQTSNLTRFSTVRQVPAETHHALQTACHHTQKMTFLYSAFQVKLKPRCNQVEFRHQLSPVDACGTQTSSSAQLVCIRRMWEKNAQVYIPKRSDQYNTEITLAIDFMQICKCKSTTVLPGGELWLCTCITTKRLSLDC